MPFKDILKTKQNEAKPDLPHPFFIIIIFFFLVSGHELKGLMAYSSLRLKHLHLPLIALVDYRGFRVVAICVLPINQHTIIYGTNDAGELK